MFPSAPCRLCNEAGHSARKCPELWMNRVPPPQKGGHGDDEEDSLTKSGNCLAQDVNQTNGSNAGQWKPLSVINI
jgi:hypothetical protein